MVKFSHKYESGLIDLDEKFGKEFRALTIKIKAQQHLPMTSVAKKSRVSQVRHLAKQSVAKRIAKKAKI